MVSGQLIIILAVAAVTLLAVAALRRVGVPTAAVLVVAGLIIGFLPFVPDVSLDPHVVLLGLLPLLVFDAAATSSATAFVRNARSIGVLAVGLVAPPRSGWPRSRTGSGICRGRWRSCWAPRSGRPTRRRPPAWRRRLGLPRRLVTILEGEALFNDGAALVLYAAAVAAATSGHISRVRTAGEIVYASAAGDRHRPGRRGGRARAAQPDR